MPDAHARVGSRAHSTSVRWEGIACTYGMPIGPTGYLVAEEPANVLLQRYPTGRVMGIVCFLWGIVVMCVHSIMNLHVAIPSHKEQEHSCVQIFRRRSRESHNSRCLGGLRNVGAFPTLPQIILTTSTADPVWGL